MMAQGFARAGAKVYITGRRVKLLEDAAASIKDVPGSVIAYVLRLLSVTVVRYDYTVNNST